MRFDILDINERVDAFNASAGALGVLPVKVGGFYGKKVLEEVHTLGGTNGPLYKCVLPTEDKVTLRAPGEVDDFVEDRTNMPDGLSDTVVQKYGNRILFFPTETCVTNCQYCFRTDVLAEENGGKELPKLDEKVETLRRYLAEHPEVEEVILSGGDPMVLPPKRLIWLLDLLKNELEVANIRLHTRTAVFAPSLFDERRIHALADAKVRLVNHIVHPYEVCDEVRAKLEQLRIAGVRLYNQFPILRGVNDHPEVLKKLLTLLDELDIRTLSMFIPDPIKFSASYRMQLSRLFRIVDELNWKSPSWINSTRVVLDTPHGKVRREDLIEYDRGSGIAIFERDGHRITYPDLPAEMDVPGQLETLLWKQ